MYYPLLLDGLLASLAVVSYKEKGPQPSVPFPSQCSEFNFSVLNFCILWVSALLLPPSIKIQQMRRTGKSLIQ